MKVRNGEARMKMWVFVCGFAVLATGGCTETVSVVGIEMPSPLIECMAKFPENPVEDFSGKLCVVLRGSSCVLEAELSAEMTDGVVDAWETICPPGVTASAEADKSEGLAATFYVAGGGIGQASEDACGDPANIGKYCETEGRCLNVVFQKIDGDSAQLRNPAFSLGDGGPFLAACNRTTCRALTREARAQSGIRCAFCGNGITEEMTEECDDGGDESQDGCSSRCEIELGFTCIDDGERSICQDCGNRRLEGSEVCDDGNNGNNDGCRSDCRALESGWRCDGPICTTVCGDGIQVRGREGCDDGNIEADDGCTPRCRIEAGYECPHPNTPCRGVCGDRILTADEPCDHSAISGAEGCSECMVQPGWTCPRDQACEPRCGDGALIGGEVCDDQNNDPNDGCHRCKAQPGWTCAEGVCETVCGDGLKRGSEGCEDRNREGGDGCTADCLIEDGWICPDEGERCQSVCGDGVLIRTSEGCDDGNNINGDGCRSDCAIDDQWECPIPGQPCQLICSNSILNNTEECDDGNLTTGDGCDGQCGIESGAWCDSTGSPCCVDNYEPNNNPADCVMGLCRLNNVLNQTVPGLIHNSADVDYFSIPIMDGDYSTTHTATIDVGSGQRYQLCMTIDYLDSAVMNEVYCTGRVVDEIWCCRDTTARNSQASTVLTDVELVPVDNSGTITVRVQPVSSTNLGCPPYTLEIETTP